MHKTQEQKLIPYVDKGRISFTVSPHQRSHWIFQSVFQTKACSVDSFFTMKASTVTLFLI